MICLCPSFSMDLHGAAEQLQACARSNAALIGVLGLPALQSKNKEEGKKIFSLVLQKCSAFLRFRPPFTGVPRGPGRKVPDRALFECFWAPASECSKECFLSVFWHFWATPVNGGWDRNLSAPHRCNMNNSDTQHRFRALQSISLVL